MTNSGDDQIPQQNDTTSSQVMSDNGTKENSQKEITLPQEATDSDLIEKEWVEKAKEIIEHTKDDPYEQQRALSAMKSDYMKKRYNRELNQED